MTNTATRSIARLNVEDRLQRFLHSVQNLPGNQYCNIIIAQVDPDAMGSAFGVAEMLQIMGLETAIWHGGGISHPQNHCLRNRFNLGAEMQHISKFSPRVSEDEDGIVAVRDNNFVIVDSNRGKDSRLPYEIVPCIVIDHHKQSDLHDDGYFTDQGFLWLDEYAGSASTMVIELLQQAIEAGMMPEGWKMSEKLATLLALGVYSDTKSLISGGERDHRAFSWVQQWTNEATISTLIDYPLEESNIQNIRKGLTIYKENAPYGYKHHNAHLLSGLGIVESYDADDLSTVADILLRKTGVDIAITWGGVRFVDDDTGDEVIKIRVCARSQTLRHDLADFLRKLFKDRCGAKQLPDGRGEGGAMFELHHDGWMNPEEMLQIVGRRMAEWLFDDVEKHNE